MLGNSTLVAFLSTSNADRAIDFYEKTLGLEKVEDTPFAIVFRTNSITLRIQKVESVSATSYTVLGWEVRNIEDIVQQLTKNGVSFEFFDSLPQDNRGIWKSPGGAKVAWFKDPDHNRLSVTQHP